MNVRTLVLTAAVAAAFACIPAITHAAVPDDSAPAMSQDSMQHDAMKPASDSAMYSGG
jgi:hypothetical protein